MRSSQGRRGEEWGVDRLLARTRRRLINEPMTTCATDTQNESIQLRHLRNTGGPIKHSRDTATMFQGRKSKRTIWPLATQNSLSDRRENFHRWLRPEYLPVCEILYRSDQSFLHRCVTVTSCTVCLFGTFRFCRFLLLPTAKRTQGFRRNVRRKTRFLMCLFGVA